jgi:uncharacterized protein (TIGR00369 family)
MNNSSKTPENAAPALSIEDAQHMLKALFAPWVQSLGLEPVAFEPGVARFRLPFSSALCREGGSVCGQAMMAAADTAMVFAISAQMGRFVPMTTVNMSSSFLRPLSSDATVTARVIKPGKSLMFGEIEMSGADGKPCFRASTTYALL